MKRRYLLLQIESGETFTQDEVMSTIWKAVTKLYGETGASKTGLSLIEYDQMQRTATVRVLLNAAGPARASIASVTEIRGRPVALHVLKVSGSIRGLGKPK